MKRVLFTLTAFLILCTSAFADSSPIALPSSIQLKQGMLLKWDNPGAGVLNLSTFTVAETVASPHFNKLENAIWEGWTIDAGFSYDAQNFGIAALMLGRDFGTLGKYLPISFPLADKFSLTVYPIGMTVDDPSGHPRVEGASGLGLIKLSVSF